MEKSHYKSLLTLVISTGLCGSAFGFSYEKGDLRLQVDSTLSAGASWRLNDRDYRGVGPANAAAAGETSHRHGTSSQDNSNLLWKDHSTFSELVKLTTEAELSYKNYGAFVRGKAFYDHRIVNGDGVTDLPAFYRQDANGNPLEPNQSDGRSADILDAFVWGEWWLGEKPVNVRLGKQVISWGESVFFPNGINTVNPVDVQALLAPGSEVKDALIPLNSIFGSIGITPNLSLEAFYLLEWQETQLPPCGTYFSTSDLIGGNCYGGFYAGGTEAGAPGAEFTRLPRGDDVTPDDDGQFGFAARYFVESIETEIAFYYMNYHSRLPVTSGYMPMPSEATVPSFGITPGALPDDLVIARNSLTSPAPSNALATLQLLPTAEYFVEYPEDIQLIGFSFNTGIDFGLPGGMTSVSGEISMRKDQPFMLEDGITVAGLAGLPVVSCENNDCYTQYDAGEYIPGFITADYYQGELSFVQFFDRLWGASRWTAILDLGFSYTDLPDESEAVLNSSYNATLNVPGAPTDPVFLQGNQVPYTAFLDIIYGNGTLAGFPETDQFPTKVAWGYKLRMAGEYNNVFAGVNLKPVISISHDVNGTTPTPISNFVEGRKAFGLSLEGVYLNKYSLKAAYTNYFGAKPYNQLADRDYFALSAAVSF